MNFSSYSSLQKIVCLDLKNATKKDLYSWFSINKTAEKTRLYIEQIINNNNNAPYESAKIERIYLQGDFVLAKTFENHDMKVEICDFFMEELKKIPLIQNEEAKKHITLFMDNFIKTSKWEMSECCFINLVQCQKKTTFSESLFLNQTIAFDIANYNLKLNEILDPKRYKPVYCELKRQYPNMKILANFIVQKMYYYNQVPVAFSAKLLGTNSEEQWFWSDQFAESLLYLEPILLAVPESDLSLNAILDKINEYGLPYLTTNEINLLEKYK